MSMIKCPECESMVSSKAIACPSCGYPIAKRAYLHSKKPAVNGENTVEKEHQRPPVRRLIFRKAMILLIEYLLVFAIIVPGFFAGRQQKVLTSEGRLVAAFLPYWWSQEYSYNELQGMFDGAIVRFEGWYGLSWERTCITYRNTTLNQDEFIQICNADSAYPEGYAQWSDKQRINYVFDEYFDIVLKKHYLIKIDNDILDIHLNTHNNNFYETAAIKTIIVCAGLLTLPIVAVVIETIIQVMSFFIKKAKAKAAFQNQ